MSRAWTMSCTPLLLSRDGHHPSRGFYCPGCLARSQSLFKLALSPLHAGSCPKANSDPFDSRPSWFLHVAGFFGCGKSRKRFSEEPHVQIPGRVPPPDVPLHSPWRLQRYSPEDLRGSPRQVPGLSERDAPPPLPKSLRAGTPWSKLHFLYVFPINRRRPGGTAADSQRGARSRLEGEIR